MSPGRYLNFSENKDTRWFLFSVINTYDQPSNNLVAWWIAKPSIEELSNAMGITFSTNMPPNTLVALANVWQGEEARYHETDWRLEQLNPGILK